MKPSVIVWDLETVPDFGGFAVANDLVGKSDVEVREAIGEKFPKHIYHSIVCIGALIAHWNLITGRWTPSARPTWARGLRRNPGKSRRVGNNGASGARQSPQ
jgi:hypothetical protein